MSIKWREIMTLIDHPKGIALELRRGQRHMVDMVDEFDSYPFPRRKLFDCYFDLVPLYIS